MLNAQFFDLWSEDYDREVIECDREDNFPFAGYRRIMEFIFDNVGEGATVLDIGIGTGFLPSKLAQKGCEIWGIDFSDKMLEAAKIALPNAWLLKADFSAHLPPEIMNTKFDCVIATYALHHLTDEQKEDFIKRVLPILKDNGTIFIGDVSFDCEEEHDRCAETAGDEWDEDEYYWVKDRLLGRFRRFCDIKYHKMSHCGAVWEIKR